MKNLLLFLKAALLITLFLFIDTSFNQQASAWDNIPEEVRERNFFQRYEWFYRQRAFPYDTVSSYIYLSEFKKEIQKMNERGENPLSDLLWSQIGPSGITSGFPSHWGQMSGRVRGVAVHPTDPNTVYIGAAAGGIWKTTSGGASWVNLTDNLPTLSYGAIAIDPNNPNNVYAGAGEILYNFSTVVYNGQGLYKSTDAGNTWTQITNGFGNVTHFGDLEVSPHNSNTIFAALGSGYYYTGNLSNEGIWRSTDGGINWTKTLFVVDAFDVIVHPTNAAQVYAACGGGVTGSGFYISFDAGANWSQSNTGLPAANTILRMQISISNSSPSTIYGVIYDGSGSPKAFKSTNGGLSWGQISAGTQLGGNYGSGWSDQGGYDLCIAVNPTNANQVFIGNIELHQSTNGSTFSPKRISGGTTAWDCPSHTDLHRIVFSPSNSSVVYIGCDGGIYKSTDAGNNWTSANNGIETIQFYRLASHPTNHDTLLGGAQDNGNFRTLNGGSTAWDFVSTGDGMECFYDHTVPTTVYFSTQNGSLNKSTNSGTTTTWLGSVNGNWLTPFFMHPQNNQWLYTANNSVLRSTNGGSSFTVIANNVSPSDKINTMSQNAGNPLNMIFAGSGWYTSNPVIKRSTDGGFTWLDITGNVPGLPRYVSRVLASPVMSNTMFVVKSGFSAGNKVYISTNQGVTWTNISSNLPDIPHNDIFVDPMYSNHYYVANDFGVYRTTNGGTTWQREGNGMPFVPAMDFSYSNSGGKRYLRVATHGRSAFETDLDNIVPVELTSFTAQVINGNVELKWTTSTELNNSGFEVERSMNDGQFESITFIPGAGTTTETHQYSYTDESISGFLKYRLRQIDFDGHFEYSQIIAVKSLVNLSFELHQNYPNPFNPITNISYILPSEANVTLTVFNTIGEAVAVLVNEVQQEGKYEAVWNAENYPSGVFFYTIDVVPVSGKQPFRTSKKMILIK